MVTVSVPLAIVRLALTSRYSPADTRADENSVSPGRAVSRSLVDSISRGSTSPATCRRVGASDSHTRRVLPSTKTSSRSAADLAGVQTTPWRDQTRVVAVIVLITRDTPVASQ